MAQQFQFRQPEYTGENRCLPCTTVNSVIAVLIATGVTIVDPFLGIGILILEAVLIYYRGYLVPGTPELTKRYMPAWALKLFGKTPVEEQLQSAMAEQSTTTDEDLIDPIEILTATGVATETADGEDITLTSSFNDRLDRQEFDDPTTGAEEVFTELFDNITIEDRGTAVYLTHADHGIILNWPSHTAMIGDAKSAHALTETDPQFTDRDEIAQVQLIQSTRTLLNSCPACHGSLSFSQEERETCCETYTVNALSCDSCGDTLLEVNDYALNEAATV